MIRTRLAFAALTVSTAVCAVPALADPFRQLVSPSILPTLSGTVGVSPAMRQMADATARPGWADTGARIIRVRDDDDDDDNNRRGRDDDDDDDDDGDDD
jgi:hypothetical protein